MTKEFKITSIETTIMWYLMLDFNTETELQFPQSKFRN